MKVAVANSSEMIFVESSKLARTSTIQKLRASVILQCHFLQALPPLEEHKDGFGMFLVADFQSVSI